MKITFKIAFVVLALVVTNRIAVASSDDVKWIAQCIKDNKDEGAKEEVVYKYCTCMNDKMDENETLSITQWEKSHPKERAACDKAAGWK
jgi:hypothetical protein